MTFSQQLSEEEISSLYQEKIELYALIKTISNQLEKMKTEETFSKKDQTALDNLRKAISIEIVGEREWIGLYELDLSSKEEIIEELNEKANSRISELENEVMELEKEKSMILVFGRMNRSISQIDGTI